MDLVHQHKLVVDHAELVLGVDEYEATFSGDLAASVEQLEAGGCGSVKQVGADQPFFDGLASADVPVVFLELGRRRQDRRRQAFVLTESVRQCVAGDLTPSRLIVEPQRCAGHAGDIAAHDELQGHRRALPHADDIWIRHVQEMVRNDVARRLEPVVGDCVQRLALEGNRPVQPVEGGDSVSDNDGAYAVLDVAVAHLPQVRIAETGERCRFQRSRHLAGNALVRDHPRAPVQS